MSMPDSSNDLARAQYQFYKSAGRLANLWYTLTIIWLILVILSFIGACVGAILGAGSVITFFSTLVQQVPK
jgi:hypothetical protein